jgi:hypothetical protein
LAHELQENGHFVVLLDLNFPEAEFAHIPLRNEASRKIKVKKLKTILKRFENSKIYLKLKKLNLNL